MAANEPRAGRAVLVLARIVAVFAVALVLAGIALPQILDSGSGHLPSLGRGSGLHSAAGSEPVASVVVPTFATGERPRRHSVAPVRKPISHGPATGGTTRIGSRPVAGTVSRPVHHTSGGGKRPTPSPHANGGTGSGITTPTTPTPQPTIAAPALEDQGSRSNGRALGHRKHGIFVPPGLARKTQSPPPRGWAFGYRAHVPPGQAKKTEQRTRGGGDDRGEGSWGDGKHSNRRGHKH